MTTETILGAALVASLFWNVAQAIDLDRLRQRNRRQARDLRSTLDALGRMSQEERP